MTTRNFNRTANPYEPAEIISKAVNEIPAQSKKARTLPPVTPIVIDTREQKGWNWENDPTVTTTRATLSTGDYTLAGHETAICIERKSLIDWVNTIVAGHGRFHEELLRMKSYDRSFIIIEASIDDICQRKYEVGAVRRNISPDSIMHMSIGIMLKYPWARVIFGDDRYTAACVCKDILRQYKRMVDDVKKGG